MKKTISFISILILGLFLSLFAIFYNYRLCDAQAQKQTVPGVMDLSETESPYLLDALLAGQWEYYPDELIFSDTIGEDQFTDIDVIDPALEGYRRAKDPSYHRSPEQILQLSSTVPNPDAEHIYLPSILANLHGQNANCSKTSYRLILENCPSTDAVDIVLSVTGMVKGSYHLFINGREVSSFIAPYSYPEYYTTLPETIELVIEVTHASSTFNICPRLSYKGIAMSVIDSYKDRMIGICCALISALIILMIFIFSLEPARFRWYFCVGLIFAVYYIMINLWATGYLSTITQYIPLYFLSQLSVLVLQFGFFMIFVILQRFYPSCYPAKAMHMLLFLLGVAWLSALLNIFLPWHTFFQTMCMIFTLIPFIMWLIFTLKNLAGMPFDLVLFNDGLLILTCGANAAMIYNEFGIPNALCYIFPCSLFCYIVLIFIATKYHQKQLMEKTLSLLDLEKETAKMQAAMLSSQLQPHFLYNALTSIQEMCYTEPESAADMIVHLSRYLRHNVDFMDFNDLVPFSQELEHIQNYMYLQNMRYGSSLNFEQHLGCTDFEIPPMSVQPLIENAINYGVRRNHNQGTIRLETFLLDKTVHIRVTNSGSGFDASHLKPNHSLCNIRKRLEALLQGQLEIISDPNALGTRVEITFRKEN